jgi:alpha-tubulin suppressor-like RCC1 family protein
MAVLLSISGAPGSSAHAVGITSVPSWHGTPDASSEPGTLTAPAPRIDQHAPVTDQVLTAITGWGPEPVNYAYAWRRDGDAIKGATKVTYRVRAADVGHRLSVRVKGSKPGFRSVTRTSASTARVTRAVFDSAPVPTVTVLEEGTPRVDKTLAAESQGWSPSPRAHSYQWYRGSAAIKRATKATYSLTAADLGSRMSVRDTAVRPGFVTAVRFSAALGPVADGLTGSVPEISNPTPMVDDVLSIDNGTWGPVPITSWRYQWYRNSSRIEGATASSYALTGSDVGKRIRVVVAGSADDYATLTRTSKPTATVAKAEFTVKPRPSITGILRVGETLTAASADPFSPAPDRVSYQWYRSGSKIKGAIGARHTLTRKDRNKRMSVTSTAHRSGYRSATTRSVRTAAVGRWKDEPFIQVSAGFGHTCGVTTSGGLRCWGNNSHGQLGTGTFGHSSTPVGVLELSEGVASVSAGGNSTCAVTKAGGVLCWGGAGDTWVPVPTAVVGLESGVAEVKVSSGSHTCARTTAGGVKCWGDNSFGQLGIGKLQPDDSAEPLDVQGLTSGVKAIAVGWAHSCAVTDEGTVKCWGANGRGQVGDGTSQARSAPVDVAGITGEAIAITSGARHTCALLTGGSLQCWGANDAGQLGTGNHTESHAPEAVPGLSSLVDASAGADFTCAITSTSSLKCWGANTYGALGNGTKKASATAVAVSRITRTREVAGGDGHTCAVTAAGTRCWGWNKYGQLGTRNHRSSTIPAKVVGP